jgi:tight adherence protein B
MPTNLPVMLLVGLGAIFVGIVGVGVALAGSSTSKRQRRLDGLEQYVGASRSSARASVATSPSAISESLIAMGERVMEGRESTSKTMALITRADLPLRAGEWLVLRVVAVIVCLAAAIVLFGGGVIATGLSVLVGAAAGLVLPSLVLKFLAGRRAKKFERQLPQLLLLAASSLSTGFSLPQALDAVAKDAPEPSAKEFSRALAETRIGADIGDSLDRLGERMDSDNMRWTAMAIRIQRQVGGNLADTLRTTAKTLMEREELRRHVNALAAEGKLSAYILIALPIFLFGYLLKVNHDYIALLWSGFLGWCMLGGAIVAMCIGIFWMRKVVEVEF